MPNQGLPVPVFYAESKDFSSKKDAGRRRRSFVPRPPAKSVAQRLLNSHAKAVSFREGTSDCLTMSKLYDSSKSDSYFRQCFEVQEKIGEGSFAEVFKARDKESGRCYAVKQARSQFRSNSDKIRQLEEVRKYESIPPHPNCVQFFKAWEEEERLYMQLELCPKSLSEFCEQNHGMSEQLVWNYLVDLLRALKHLHDRDLVHLDVKPDNIFISSHGVLKLGDFGLVHDLKNARPGLEAQDGDGKYLAPEVMNRDEYSKAADIFSLGMTILEIAVDLDVPSSGPLWSDLRLGKLPENKMNEAGLSEDLRDIIRMMLRPVPGERPSVDRLLSHPKISRVARQRHAAIACYDLIDSAKSKTWALWWAFLSRIWLVWGWVKGMLGFPHDSRFEAPSQDEIEPDPATRDRLSISDSEATGDYSQDSNGTPPNIRESCAKASPVLKSRRVPAGEHLFSPKKSLPSASAFHSTPMFESQRTVPLLSTPQLTPVMKHVSPRLYGNDLFDEYI